MATKYFKVEFGTAIIFGEAGATGVTVTLSFNNLASGSGVMSTAFDLGEQWYQLYTVQSKIETGTAPTAGGTVDFYAASSLDDGTTYPGGCTGTAGAWPADGSEDEWAAQLALIHQFKATNDGTTLGIQAPTLWMPKSRYNVIVCDNNMSQGIRNEGTATDNDSRLIIRPYMPTQRDAA